MAESDNQNSRNRKKTLKLSPKNHKIVLHNKLHNALKLSDLATVKKLIKLKVPLCFENKEENCYTLAQDKENAEYLTLLLEYDPSGANALNLKASSLLMRDIHDFGCRHAELLIDMGANVNYFNNCHVSILHFAVMNKSTPINIIKKLLESKADIHKKRCVEPNKKNELMSIKFLARYSNRNVDEFVDGDTPLHSLIKCYDKDLFEKVKLLVDYGADVNLKNSVDKTPLMLAVSLKIDEDKADLNLIKYLINHGVKYERNRDLNYLSSLIYTLNECTFSSEDHTISCIRNYFIPAVDLLLETGADLFLKDHRNDSVLSNLIHNYEKEYYELFIHLFKCALNKLCSGIKIDRTLQSHPLECLLKNLSFIGKDERLQPEICKLIISHQSSELKNYEFVRIDYGNSRFTLWNSFNLYPGLNVGIFGASLFSFPIDFIIQWFTQLIDNNMDISKENHLLRILVTRYMHLSKKADDHLMAVVDYLINIIGLEVSTTDVSLNNYSFEVLQLLYQIPDCILVFSLHGNIKCLIKFLPYWNQHPLIIVLFLRPWLQVGYGDEKKTMILLLLHLVPFLIDIGGPLSHGTKSYNVMQRYIENLKNLKNQNKSHINILISNINSTHASPANLKILCRTVIRNNATGHGNNLPDYLESLVSFPGLKKFLSFKGYEYKTDDERRRSINPV